MSADRVGTDAHENYGHGESLIGVWRIVHKRQNDGYSRLWFTSMKSSKSFAYTSVSGDLHWKTVRKLQVGDYVRLAGLLTEKAELNYIRRCTKKH